MLPVRNEASEISVIKICDELASVSFLSESTTIGLIAIRAGVKSAVYMWLIIS
jgi:hypothetical protein